MWEVFEQELFEFFICHLFDGFWKAEKKIEFVEVGVGVTHIIASHSKVSFGK